MRTPRIHRIERTPWYAQFQFTPYWNLKPVYSSR